MERVSNLASASLQGLRRVSAWTHEELAVQQQRLGTIVDDLRPRKRARTDRIVQDSHAILPASYLKSVATPTTPARLRLRRAQPKQIFEPTPIPEASFQGRDLVLDTVSAPSAASDAPVFTGATVAGSQGVFIPTETATAGPSQSVVVVTASPSASAAASSGMSTTTEAIIISCSIAGALVIVTLMCLLGLCYRRRRRRAMALAHPDGTPQRMPSSSTARSDTWRSESSEPEKQSLILSQPRSRSVSPSTREPASGTPSHQQQRSLGGYKPFMDTIPESPRPGSPTSVYTKRSPPQPTASGQLQLQYTQMQAEKGPLSPLRPPPLRLRQSPEDENNSAVNSALLPSPKNMFSAVRLPFMSGLSGGKRRSSTGQSVASSYDEERNLAANRRTMESETLPAPGVQSRYRDSFWSLAASSIAKNSGFKSGYGDSMYGSSLNEFSHTRTNSSSFDGHSRTPSSNALGLNADEASLAPIHGRARSHSSVYSQRRPSQALIPALPPMPAQYELEQRQGHKAGFQNQSVGSMASGVTAPPGDVELKGRLHSVDFWAREERDMRLGTFAPAELEGSSGVTPTAEMPTPRDSKGMVIGAALDSTPRNSNPYFAAATAGHTSIQGAYSIAAQGAGGSERHNSLMAHGYSPDPSKDGERLWNRSSSRDRSANPSHISSASTATVFRAHPGEMVYL